MLWSSCNLILYSFFLKYILLLRLDLSCRLPSEAVSTCPSHLCSCRCEQAGCLQQSEISYIELFRLFCQSSEIGSGVSPCTTVHVSSRINNIFTLNFQIW